MAGEYTPQIERQQKILREDPSNLDAAYELGNYLAWDGRYAEALGAYQSIVEKEPKYIEAEVGIARVESWMGRQESARQKYEVVLKKDPKNYEAYQGLGSLALWTNDFARSIEYFNQALALNAKDIVSHKGIGRAYLALGDRRRADLHFTQAQILELRQMNPGWAIGALATVAAVALLLAAALRHWRRRRWAFILRLELELLRRTIELYHQRNGKFPLAPEQLLREKRKPLFGQNGEQPYLVWRRALVKGSITDPFGHRYWYNADNGAINTTTTPYENW